MPYKGRTGKFSAAAVLCLLTPALAYARIDTVRFFPAPTGTHVYFEMSGRPNYTITPTTNPNRVEILISNQTLGELNRYLGSTSYGYKSYYDDVVIQTIDVRQYQSNVVRVRVDLNVPPSTDAAITDYGSSRYMLAIEFRRPPDKVEHRYDLQAVRAFKANGGKVAIVSAGHGGLDPGNRGLLGLVEKDLNLDICLRLEELLNRNSEKTKVMAILARWGDYLPAGALTKDRTWTALIDLGQYYDADLFVEVHHNSSRGSVTLPGAEIFVLHEDTASTLSREEAQRLRANGSSSSSAAILAQMQRDQILKNSWDFATQVLREMRKVKELGTSRGIKTRSFNVLRRLDMPASLVEVCFLNHRGDAALAAKAEFRQRVAHALGLAITEYLTGQHDIQNYLPPPEWKGVPVDKYAVKTGDTLESIAIRYNTTVAALKTANNLTNNVIRPGDRLVIPASGETAVAQSLDKGLIEKPREVEAVQPQPVKVRKIEIVSHKVKRGETLSELSDHYKVPLDTLLKTNGYKSSRSAKIVVGQNLKIPVEKWVEVAPASVSKPALPEGEPVYHRIAKGETLDKIASEYKTTAKNLVDWNNNIVRASAIKANERIIVGWKPKAEEVPAPAGETPGPALAAAPPSAATASSTLETAVAEALKTAAEKLTADATPSLELAAVTSPSPETASAGSLEAVPTPVIQPNAFSEKKDLKVVVVVPAAAETPIAPPPSVSDYNNSAPQPEPLRHRIQPGETLGKIASQYPEMTAEKLASFNNIRDPRRIQSGDTIRIPVTSTAIAAAPPEEKKVEVAKAPEPIATQVEAAPVETSPPAEASPAPATPVAVETPVVAAVPTPETPVIEQATPATAETPAPEAITYIVQKGDTLEGISKKYPGITSDRIAAANAINKPSEIHPGMKLFIPPPGMSVAALSNQTEPPKEAPEEYIDTLAYVVHKGETLDAIAAKYPGISVKDIMRENGIRDPNKVLAGTKLSIPIINRLKQETPPAPLPPEVVVYAVKRNQTVWDIAREFPGVSASDIIKENGIKDPSKVQAGSKLRIPVSGTASAKGQVASHVVQPGENLWDIAKKFGVDVKDIQQKSNLKSTVIKPGDYLLIPVRGS